MWDLRNRGILRGRFFLGAALLVAAVLTWAIGVTMSPHGETVAQGTEYLRTVIVTFKRNNAIGTLLLCALAGWLLFPAKRPKWPARDWALGLLLAFLGVSSIYTVAWVWTAVPHTQGTGENAQAASVDSNLTANEAAAPAIAPNIAIAPARETKAQARNVTAPAKSNDQPAVETTEPAANSGVTEEQASPNNVLPDSAGHVVNNSGDENQE